MMYAVNVYAAVYVAIGVCGVWCVVCGVWCVCGVCVWVVWCVCVCVCRLAKEQAFQKFCQDY